MEIPLTNHSNADELLRLKKAVMFIREVVRSYEIGLYDHVGFSCALAISKAEELKGRVARFCPVISSFDLLIEGLNDLSQGKKTVNQTSEALDEISAYFKLDRYSLVPKHSIL